MSSWRRNRALFDSLRPRRETKKRSLRSLRYRNGISQISADSLSRATQGKQRNAIIVTQTIPLARIVLSIGEAYSWNKWISPSITRNASIAGILLRFWLANFCMFHYYVTKSRSFICSIITLLTRALLCVPLLRYWFAHFDMFHYYNTDTGTFSCSIITSLICAALSVALLRH